MVITQRLTLDVARDGVQGNVILVRGERGARAIAVTLRNGKLPVSFESGQTAALQGVKPDGGEIFNSCLVYTGNGVYPNTVLYHVTEGTVAAVGTYTVRLIVWNVEGDILWSPAFSITVKDNTALDSAVGSQSEFTALIDAAAEAQRAVLAFEQEKKDIEEQLQEQADAVASEFETVRKELEEGDTAFSEHESDQKNPHGVTAEQVGLGSAASDIAALQREMGAAEGDIDALGGRMGTAESGLAALGADALRKKAPDETQVVQGAVNFNKAVRFGGQVIFEGTTTTSDQTVMTVEDALIVVNSGGAATGSIKGLVIRTEKGDYAFFHDPDDDAIKLSLGSYTVETGEDGKKKVYFTPASGQAQSLVTRDALLDGHWLRWDAGKSTVVDAGKPTPGRLLMADANGNVIDGNGEMGADARLIIWNEKKGCFVDSGKTLADIVADYEAYVDKWVASRGENGTVKVADAVDADDAVNLGTMVRLASNPLKVEKAGKTVVPDDIAPAPNAVKVTVESKNLVPAVYHSSRNATEFPYSVVVAGITFTVNEDGSVTLNGKNDGTDNSSFFLVSSIDNPFILKKGTYIGTTGVDGLSLAAKPLNSPYMNFKNPYTVEEDIAFQYLYFGVSKDSTTEFNGETAYPMLMRGTVAEDYVEPLAAGTAVTLVCGGEEIPTAVGETVELFNVAKGTELSTDNDVAVLHAEYNRDINIAFAELQQAIISLGGNV